MQHVKWQVIILAENLKASGDSDKIAIDLKNMFKSILSVDYPPDVNINICVHTDFGVGDLFDTNFQNNQLNIQDGAGLRIFRLLSNQITANQLPQGSVLTLSSGIQSLQLLENKTDITLSSEETVTAAFLRCNEDVSFEKSIILTFDHANAFGMFKDKFIKIRKLNKENGWVETEWKVKSRFSINYYNPQKPVFPFKRIPPGSKSGDLSPYFTMDELARAIEASFPKKKADLVIMLNCFMMSMDTLFALKFTVDFLVAPQTSICFYGYHYNAIFSALAQDFSLITPEELCRLAVKSIAFSPEYSKYPKYLGKLALYGADLSVFREGIITERENKLFEIIHTADQQIIDKCKEARKKIWSLSFTASLSLRVSLIDTIGWFEKCAPILQNESFNQLLIELKESIQKMIGGINPISYIGSTIPTMKKMPSNGTSNFIPFRSTQLAYPCFEWFYFKQSSTYADQSDLKKYLIRAYNP